MKKAWSIKKRMEKESHIEKMSSDSDNLQTKLEKIGKKKKEERILLNGRIYI